MAAGCGVTKRTQLAFEKDAHLPGGAYLIAAHALGVELEYVLTGNGAFRNATERDLIEAYRRASPPARAAAAAALSGAPLQPPARTQFTETTIGQQFSGDVDLRGQRIVLKTPKRKARS